MARECGDCYWSEIKHGHSDYSWHCKKRVKRIESGSDPACSQFQSSDAKTCEDCEYYEGGKYKWNTSGICSLKGNKRRDSDKACASFCEF